MIARRPEKTTTMQPGDWAIQSQCVITPDGPRAAAVWIRGDKIVAMLSPDQLPHDCPVENFGHHVVSPGLIDTHVHINEPGRTEWEGFATATCAAAAGGITTLIDMPLNSAPVTTSPAALQQKLAAAQGKLWVDCGFYGGVVPDNGEQLELLLAAGVLGVKAFLCHSGIEDFPNVTEKDLRAAMPRIARSGLPLLVHAEITSPLPVENRAMAVSEDRSYRSYLASRPRDWEHAAIRLMIELCREYRCRVHIVHLSAADALPLIAEARAAGLPLTVETCPHYLSFAAEEIPDGDPRFKCAPPIREQENRERLWEGLRLGLIDTIGSDHSPAPPEMKQLAAGDLKRAWGGIASLQLVLPAVWSQARPRGFTMVDIANWLSWRPAELVGLSGRKGSIAGGHDADLVVFSPDVSFPVDPAKLLHRHKITPYEGRTLCGAVVATILRGRKIYEAGRVADSPSGQRILQRSDFQVAAS